MPTERDGLGRYITTRDRVQLTGLVEVAYSGGDVLLTLLGTWSKGKPLTVRVPASACVVVTDEPAVVEEAKREVA